MTGRNYRREYDKQFGKPGTKLSKLTPKQKQNRKDKASRNKARAKMKKAGRVKVGDGKDVDHKDRNPRNNGTKNLRVQSKSKNRSRNK